MSTMFVVCAGLLLIIIVSQRNANLKQKSTKKPITTNKLPNSTQRTTSATQTTPQTQNNQNSLSSASWKIFEFAVTGQAPKFEQFNNATFVGRTLATKNYGDVSECETACHANKYCSHFEIPKGTKTCVLKNRQLAQFDGDVDVTNLLGFEPLPECVGKRCMDGYNSGATTMMHPSRMDAKPNGQSDKLKAYREIANLFQQMKDAITCNALCQFAKVMNIVGLVFMVTGAVGMLGTAFRASVGAAASQIGRAGAAYIAVEAAVTATELGAVIPNNKQQARTQQELEKAFKAVAENPAFVYHNIRGNDLTKSRDGIDCLQFCENSLEKNGQILLLGLAGLNEPNNASKKAEYVKESRRLVDVCCTGLPTPEKRKQCYDKAFSTKVGEFFVGNKLMCDGGNAILDSMAWARSPTAPNNYSDVTFQFFRKKKEDFW